MQDLVSWPYEVVTCMMLWYSVYTCLQWYHADAWFGQFSCRSTDSFMHTLNWRHADTVILASNKTRGFVFQAAAWRFRVFSSWYFLISQLYTASCGDFANAWSTDNDVQKHSTVNRNSWRSAIWFLMASRLCVWWERKITGSTDLLTGVLDVHPI